MWKGKAQEIVHKKHVERRAEIQRVANERRKAVAKNKAWLKLQLSK